MANNQATASQGSVALSGTTDAALVTGGFSAALSSLFSETTTLAVNSSASSGSEQTGKHQKNTSQQEPAAQAPSGVQDVVTQAVLPQSPAPPELAPMAWDFSSLAKAVPSSEVNSSATTSIPAQQSEAAEPRTMVSSLYPGPDFRTSNDLAPPANTTPTLVESQQPFTDADINTPDFASTVAGPLIQDDQSVASIGQTPTPAIPNTTVSTAAQNPMQSLDSSSAVQTGTPDVQQESEGDATSIPDGTTLKDAPQAVTAQSNELLPLPQDLSPRFEKTSNSVAFAAGLTQSLDPASASIANTVSVSNPARGVAKNGSSPISLKHDRSVSQPIIGNSDSSNQIAVFTPAVTPAGKVDANDHVSKAARPVDGDAPAPAQSQSDPQTSSNLISTKPDRLVAQPILGTSDFTSQVPPANPSANSVDKADENNQTSKIAKSADADAPARDQSNQQAVTDLPQPVIAQSTAAVLAAPSLHATALQMPTAPLKAASAQDNSGNGYGYSALDVSAPSHASSSSSLQAYGAVSTSKLIQTLGQSEMKVGLRSAEFGDISIRTSATPDNISAQISLSHEDLARSLTAHIPEMQAKMGVANGFEITVNASDRSSGSASSMSNADSGSQGSHHQQAARSYSSRFSISGVSEQTPGLGVFANVAHNFNRDGRIDLQA